MKKIAWVGIILILLILTGTIGYFILNNKQPASSTYNTMTIPQDNPTIITNIPNASNNGTYSPIY